MQSSVQPFVFTARAVIIAAKRQALFPRLPSTSVLADAAVSVSVYVRACATVCACLCGHVRMCVCVCVAVVYMEDQGFLWKGVIYCEHKSLKFDPFFKLQTLDRPPVPYSCFPYQPCVAQPTAVYGDAYTDMHVHLISWIL